MRIGLYKENLVERFTCNYSAGNIYIRVYKFRIVASQMGIRKYFITILYYYQYVFLLIEVVSPKTIVGRYKGGQKREQSHIKECCSGGN